MHFYRSSPLPSSHETLKILFHLKYRVLKTKLLQRLREEITAAKNGTKALILKELFLEMLNFTWFLLPDVDFYMAFQKFQFRSPYLKTKYLFSIRLSY